MAVAALANIPEVMGLYTTCIPALIFALFSTSRHVSLGRPSSHIFTTNFLGTFAVVGLLVRSFQYKHLPANSTMEFTSDMDLSDLPSVKLIATLTFTVGIVMVLMSILQLHVIASYMSDSLITGFTTAASIHIMIKELPPVMQLVLPIRSGYFKAIYVRVVG